MVFCHNSIHSIFKSQSMPDKDSTSSPDVQATPTSISSFDGMKSEDEEEEQPVADRQEEEVEDEEVDEAELEAFLDGQLAERHPFLQQEGCRRGIAMDSQEHNSFSVSKAEDALQTCKFHVKGSVHTNDKNIFFSISGI